MASLLGLPMPKLDWTASDLTQAFRTFKSVYQLIFDDPLSKVDEETKMKYLQIWAKSYCCPNWGRVRKGSKSFSITLN